MEISRSKTPPGSSFDDRLHVGGRSPSPIRGSHEESEDSHVIELDTFQRSRTPRTDGWTAETKLEQVPEDTPIRDTTGPPPLPVKKELKDTPSRSPFAAKRRMPHNLARVTSMKMADRLLGTLGLSKRERAVQYFNTLRPQEDPPPVSVGAVTATEAAAPLEGVVPDDETKSHNSRRNSSSKSEKDQPEKEAATATTTGKPPPPRVNNDCDVWKFKDFRRYGLPIHLYFHNLRWMCILFFGLAVLSLPSVGYYYNYNALSLAHRSFFEFERFSVGNLGDYTVVDGTDQDPRPASVTILNVTFSRAFIALWLCVTDAAVSLGFILFVWYMMRTHHHTQLEFQQEFPATVDFSVTVSNLPRHFNNRHRLAEWFQLRYGDVVEVVLEQAEDYGFYDNYIKRGNLGTQLKMAMQDYSNGGKLDTDLIDSLNEQIVALDAVLLEVDKVDRDSDNFPLRRAHITFNDPRSRVLCMRDFSNAWLPTLKRYMDPAYVFAEQRLRVTRAMEPTQILLRNFNLESSKVWLRRFLVIVLYFTVFVATGSFQYWAAANRRPVFNVYTYDCPVMTKTLATAVTVDSRDLRCYCDQLGWDVMHSQSAVDCTEAISQWTNDAIFNGVLVFSILLGNILLVWGSSRYDKHVEAYCSVNIQEYSTMLKVFIGVTINTSVLLLLDNATFETWTTNPIVAWFFNGKYGSYVGEWYSAVGTVILFVFCTFVLLPPLHLFLRVCLHHMKTRKLTPEHSWEDWQIAYTPAKFELAPRYGLLLCVIFTAFSYSGGMPLFYAAAFCMCFSQYWCDKYSFLRLYASPVSQREGHLNDIFLHLMIPSILIHACSSFWTFTSPILYDTFSNGVGIDVQDPTEMSINVIGRLSQLHAVPLTIVIFIVMLLMIVYKFFGTLYCARSVEDLLLATEDVYTYDDLQAMGIDFNSYLLSMRAEFRPAFTFKSDAMKALTSKVAYRTLRRAKENETRILNGEKKVQVLSQGQMIRMREIFDHFDVDGSGTIDRYELKSAMEDMGHTPRDEDIDVMMQSVDINEDGEIEFAQLCKMMADQIAHLKEQVDGDSFSQGGSHDFGELTELTLEQINMARDVFMRYDADSSGTISVSELDLALMDVNKTYSREEIAKMVSAVDVDANGELDFEEFCQVMVLHLQGNLQTVEEEEEFNSGSDSNVSELRSYGRQALPSGGARRRVQGSRSRSKHPLDSDESSVEESSDADTSPRAVATTEEKKHWTKFQPATTEGEVVWELYREQQQQQQQPTSSVHSWYNAQDETNTADLKPSVQTEL